MPEHGRSRTDQPITRITAWLDLSVCGLDLTSTSSSASDADGTAETLRHSLAVRRRRVMVSAKKEKKGTGAEKRRAEAAVVASQQGKPFRKEKKKVSASTAPRCPTPNSPTGCAGKEEQT